MAFPVAVEGQDQTILVEDEGGGALNAAEAWVFYGLEGFRGLVVEPGGRLVLTPEVLQGFRRIVIRHLGYRSVFIFPEDLADVQVVRMQREAVQIEGVVATAARESCPVRDDPEARTRWQAVIRGYALPSGPRTASAKATVHRDTKSEALLFSGPTIREPGWFTLLGGIDPMQDTRRPVAVQDWIATRGLVTGNRYPFITRFLNWTYPRFDGPDATFFGSQYFMDQATFRFLSSDDELIRFCFSGDDMSGTGRITNGRVAEIAWSFGELDPDERAGGRAVFDTSEDAPPWLVPIEGLYYRLASPGNPHLYYREVTEFENWTIRSTAGGDPSPN